MKTFIKIDLIYNYLKKNKMSKSEFCKKAEISIGVLNKILADKTNFKIEAIVKIANLIGTNTMFNY